jgi:geranylgeranyl diphosphate synthase, type I
MARDAAPSAKLAPRTGLSPDPALEQVEALMTRLTSGPRSCALGKIGNEHLAGGGKRIRARLALASAEALGVQRAAAVPWAAAVELLHNASLIHDDLQDGDKLRRGRPTTWAVWGANQAINAGDLLLLLPFVALSEVPADAEVRAGMSEVLALAATEMARGQAAEPGLVDALASDDPWTPYADCVRGKTGALFGVPVAGAALLAGRGRQRAHHLALVFNDLGMLFQLQDDVLDLYGDKGRERPGNDLREGKVSALVAEHARRHPSERAFLLEALRTPRGETRDEDVARLAREFVEGGALGGVLERIWQLARAARQSPALVSAPGLVPLMEELLTAVLRPIDHLFTSEDGAECADASPEESAR